MWDTQHYSHFRDLIPVYEFLTSTYLPHLVILRSEQRGRQKKQTFQTLLWALVTKKTLHSELKIFRRSMISLGQVVCQSGTIRGSPQRHSRQLIGCAFLSHILVLLLVAGHQTADWLGVSKLLNTIHCFLSFETALFHCFCGLFLDTLSS
jgi:hypothetical protein